MNEVILNDLDYIMSQLHNELPSLSGGNVLVTGGAGFIGYYLIQMLLRSNYKKQTDEPIRVILLDNFIRGVPQWINLYKDDPHFIVKNHDICSPLPDNLGLLTHIIHAASIASPTFYRRYPIETIDANVNGLRVLLDYCKSDLTRSDHLESFLFFSSSEVYGDPPPDKIPTSEDYWGNVSFTGPRSCYDESKRFGETLAVNYANIYNIPIKIVRPFNNYGPGLKLSDRRVICDFAQNILNGKDVIMLSDGLPTRTFCYIADAIVGYIKVLVNGNVAEAYNIGNGEQEISIAQLAQMMSSLASQLFGYSRGIVHRVSDDKKYLTDNPSRRCPDVTKAKNELGFMPKIDLDEGLRRTLLWYNFQSQSGVDI